MRIEKIPLSEIRENSYNPNRMEPEMFEALVNCIRDHGFVQPLVVRRVRGRYEIVDGAHRLRALQQAGRTEAECVVVKAGPHMAKLRTLAMNRLRGRMDNFYVARLLKQQKRPDIEKYLAYSRKHSAELRELLKRAPAVRLPEAPRTPVVVEFLMTREDAAVVNEALRAAGGESRNASLLRICEHYVRKTHEG